MQRHHDGLGSERERRLGVHGRGRRVRRRARLKAARSGGRRHRPLARERQRKQRRLAAAAAVETTSDCGYLADFVTPCFTPQISPPSLIFRNHLPYSIKLYQIENEGDAPRMRRNLGAGTAMNFGAPNSGLWIVTTESGHIETINGQCYYIVEGDGPHDLWFD